jgi:hypothetical protein
MSPVETFVTKLLKGKGSTETYEGFTKYYNDKFEIFVFDNKVLVKDKRYIHKTIIYNGIKVAQAKLIDLIAA